MDRITERAARSGIASEYDDGLARRRIVEPEVLALLLDSIGANGKPRMLPRIPVVRQGVDREIPLDAPDRRIRWKIDTLAIEGEAAGPTIILPVNLPTGCFRLRATSGEYDETATLLVAPARTYQGHDECRSWALAVQLYSIRSQRNWGHGDFTDLQCLVELAAELGAACVGLNPLHYLFDDQAEQPSPYFASSRLFLNPLYIDVEAISEFPGFAHAVAEIEIDELRRSDLVDYAGVARVKQRALTLSHERFRKHASRQRQDRFDKFRRDRGPVLTRFACFELLRRRFKRPWWEWPQQWRKPDQAALDGLRKSDADAIAYHEFLQWIADEQLSACRDKAKALGLPIGLFLDVAVGVRSDGFDAWNDQDVVLSALEVGAPPDLLNSKGQKWGLAGINPVNLVTRDCEPFRQVLQASMRYAGAIRLDHVLGLNRLSLLCCVMKADRGEFILFSLR